LLHGRLHKHSLIKQTSQYTKEINSKSVPLNVNKKTFSYCGRKLGVDKIPDSNGTCGPCCGPSCDDCKNCKKKDEVNNSMGINVVGLINDS
jgi:hypothetical protein